MAMDLSIDQVRACKDAALISNKCIIALAKQKIFDSFYLRSFKQCDDLCVAFLHAASTDSIYLEKIALLCVGLCEECVEICEDLKNKKLFKEALSVFQNCSNLLSTENLYKSATYKH